MKTDEATFDLSSYVQAVTRTFDQVRSTSNLLGITCGLVFLFLVRVHPYQGFPSELDFLDAAKTDIDTANGQIKGMRALAQTLHQGELGELENEEENTKRSDIASAYCAITSTKDDEICEQNVISELTRSRDGNEEEYLKVINDRRKELQAAGTGFKVPLVDVVVEPTYVPMSSTILLSAIFLVLRGVMGNWVAAVRLALQESRDSGKLRTAQQLISMNCMALRAVDTSRTLSQWLRHVTIGGLSLLPFVLNSLLLWRHRYIFRLNPSEVDSSLSVPITVGYCVATLFILCSGLLSALDVFKVRRELRKAAPSSGRTLNASAQEARP